MRIILLGSSGFLGRNLMRNLQHQGHDVIAMKFRPAHKDAFQDMLSKQLVSQFTRLIINAGAAQLSADDGETIQQLCASNVLLPSILAAEIKQTSPATALINFGTHWQFGTNGEYHPFNAYAATKQAAEDVLEYYALSGLKVASLILYETYGNDDTRNKLLNLLIQSVKTGKRLEMSPGDQVLNFVHIDDVSAAVNRAISALLELDEFGGHLKASIKSSDAMTVKNLVKMVADLSAKQVSDIADFGVLEYRARERFSEVPSYKSLQGWTPRIRLIDGISDMLHQARTDY